MTRRDAIVVGAGFSGLYMLHTLRRMGLSAVALDQADGVGGTWYWNRYPGARCDIESMTYSYSFSRELEQEWTWTERYATQPEILAYLEHVADRFDLRRDLRLGTRAVAAAWDEAGGEWLVETDGGGRFAGTYLVMATGPLSVPRFPDIPGRERFAGAIHHTGLWPREGVDVRGRRVAVVGTGSSGVQVVPVLARDAAAVTVFQRTANFSVPAWNRPLAPDDVARHKADYPRLRRLARTTVAGNPWAPPKASIFSATPQEREAEFDRRYAAGAFCIHSAYSDLFADATANDLLADYLRRRIRERVDDPAVGELLCPHDHFVGTKRMCVDIDYFETFNLPHVRLVSVRDAPIAEFTAAGLRAGGEEHAFDVIVLGTGFDALTGALLAVNPRGRGGLELRTAWADGYSCYLGIAIAGFPNLFTIVGPSSPSVLSNMLVSIEQHVEWIAGLVAHARARGAATIEATEAAQAGWMAHHRAVGDASLYPRARSWYMGRNVAGKPEVLLPYVGGVGAYRARCEEIAAAGYRGFAFADRATLAAAPPPGRRGRAGGPGGA